MSRARRRRPFPLLVATVSALVASPLALAAPEALPMKASIRGFIDMQTIAWHNADGGQPTFTLQHIRQFPRIFAGIVLNATWSEMQPQSGGPLVTKRIDAAIARVRRYNINHPSDRIALKLRIFAGNQAPDWAKAIDGGPITIQRNPAGCNTGDCSITIGKVWDAQYIAAWRAFQRRVAARYDSDPLIRSVAITSCAMETDEPFVMPIQQKVPPGYTDAAGRACLRGAVDDYAPWRRTPIDFTINAFLPIQMGGKANSAFSIAIMKACRAKLGRRCELGNHAFGADMVDPNLGIVQAIAAKRGLIHYQTVGPKKTAVFVGWSATVRAARQYNATAIELWPDAKYGGFMRLSVPAMQKLKAIFSASSP
jgi:hypothetical protein